MRRSAAVFSITLALSAIDLAGAQAQDRREEGPFKIEKCRTIDKPGSYKLVNNITFTATSGACLQITASFVTIDLSGFTISGPRTETTTMAIQAGDDLEFGISVRNGSISDFNTGVTLAGDGSIVEGLRVRCADFSDVGIEASGIVRGNTVFGCGLGGDRLRTGISASGVVTGNSVNVVTRAGFRVTGISILRGSTVIGNTVVGSPEGAVGIAVSCPSNVTDNTAINLVLSGDGCNNTNNVAPFGVVTL